MANDITDSCSSSAYNRIEKSVEYSYNSQVNVALNKAVFQSVDDVGKSLAVGVRGSHRVSIIIEFAFGQTVIGLVYKSTDGFV